MQSVFHLLWTIALILVYDDLCKLSIKDRVLLLVDPVEGYPLNIGLVLIPFFSQIFLAFWFLLLTTKDICIECVKGIKELRQVILPFGVISDTPIKKVLLLLVIYYFLLVLSELIVTEFLWLVLADYCKLIIDLILSHVKSHFFLKLIGSNQAAKV